MRKTKENIALTPKDGFESRESKETENEERWEAMNGEASTEGVGAGYDEDVADASFTERAEATADGPLSGDVTDPPATDQTRKRKRKRRGIEPPDSRSNHPAEFNPKAI
jgi:hypothetical protein